MLSVKEKGLLLYIIKHCKRVEEKIAGINLDDFFKDMDIKEIVCFNILQIGELVKHFESSFITRYSDIPWKQIKGMRDRVAHGYDTVDFEEIWKAASKDIVPLREYCEEIINSDNDN